MRVEEPQDSDMELGFLAEGEAISVDCSLRTFEYDSLTSCLSVPQNTTDLENFTPPSHLSISSGGDTDVTPYFAPPSHMSVSSRSVAKELENAKPTSRVSVSSGSHTRDLDSAKPPSHMSISSGSDTEDEENLKPPSDLPISYGSETILLENLKPLSELSISSGSETVHLENSPQPSGAPSSSGSETVDLDNSPPPSDPPISSGSETVDLDNSPPPSDLSISSGSETVDLDNSTPASRLSIRYWSDTQEEGYGSNPWTQTESICDNEFGGGDEDLIMQYEHYAENTCPFLDYERAESEYTGKLAISHAENLRLYQQGLVTKVSIDIAGVDDVHASNLYALSIFYNGEYPFDRYEEELEEWLYKKSLEAMLQAESGI